jgi:transposase
MKNSIRYVGLDVHRVSVRACIRDQADRIVGEHNLDCTREALRAFAKSHLGPKDLVALEATFHSWSIVDVLEPFVSRVVVSNPLATKAIAESKVKTDKIDARVLSELLRLNYLPEVWTPDQPTRELRSLCSRHAGLVSDIVRIKNRIHGVLAKALVPKREGDTFDRRGRVWLAALELPEHPAGQLASDLRLLKAAEAELELHDETLVKKAWGDSRIKLLMTLPGVDVLVALAVLAALGEVTRFKNPDRVAGYLGLAPSTYQSADRCYHGPITKRGNGKARWLLIQAAQHVGSHPGPLGVFFRRIATRKNRKVAVVATARKLALIAWHMLTANEPYRYAQPLPTQNKLSKFRVRATGQKRKTGPKKGSSKSSNYGKGLRTRLAPSLHELYKSEDLPKATPPTELKKAERRVIREMGVDRFVDSLGDELRITKKTYGAESLSKAILNQPQESPLQ